jgi:cytochrome c-type biogenesis protein CcmH/NrfG
MLAKEPADRFPDLDAAIAAFGAPSPTHLDMVRAQLMAIARSGEEKWPRLSVPLSPVPATRPSAQKTVLTPVPSAGAPKRRKRTLLWIAGAVVLLAIPTYFLAARWMPASRAPDRNAALTRGVQLWQQRQLVAARAELARAATEMPRSALPHVYLSRMSRESGDLARARAEAARAVQLEPNNAVALREMGSVLLATGNHDLARRFFARALRAAPDDRASMGWLGCTLQRLGQPEQANRWLQRAGQGPWSACRP